jgi:ribosomal protection tetracycline resistance protein
VGDTWTTLEGEIRVARIQELQRSLGSLTRGEGVVESWFDRYEPVTADPPPSRRRTDANPLDRREYLLRLSGRATSFLP